MAKHILEYQWLFITTFVIAHFCEQMTSGGLYEE